VASRIATELIIEVRYMLRSLGVALNMSLVLNITSLSSVLKKMHNGIAYHRVREAIALKMMKFSYIKSEKNISDVFTKPLSN
jgi:hypothetical protein